MSSPESRLIAQIFAKHGARPDLRLFRNETAGAWVGKMQGRTERGDVVIARARPIQCGLCVGSADLIGVGRGGRFIAIEVKTDGVAVTKQQKRFLAMVELLGGIAGVARSVEDVTALLGEPPKPGDAQEAA